MKCLYIWLPTLSHSYMSMFVFIYTTPYSLYNNNVTITCSRKVPTSHTTLLLTCYTSNLNMSTEYRIEHYTWIFNSPFAYTIPWHTLPTDIVHYRAESHTLVIYGSHILGDIMSPYTFVTVKTNTKLPSAKAVFLPREHCGPTHWHVYSPMRCHFATHSIPFFYFIPPPRRNQVYESFEVRTWIGGWCQPDFPADIYVWLLLK